MDSICIHRGQKCAVGQQILLGIFRAFVGQLAQDGNLTTVLGGLTDVFFVHKLLCGFGFQSIPQGCAQGRCRQHIHEQYDDQYHTAYTHKSLKHFVLLMYFFISNPKDRKKECTKGSLRHS